MKKTLLLFLLFISVNICNAQIREIDSLQQKLSVSVEDTNKVQVLIALSMYDQSYEHGLLLAEEALALAKKLGDKKGEGQSLHQMANQFRSVNNFPLALHYEIESLKIAEQLKDSLSISRALGGIGSGYRSQGDHRMALSFYLKSNEIQKSIRNNYRLAVTNGNIGETYELLNQLDSALIYFNNSYSYFNSGRDKYQMAYALNGLGSVQTKFGNAELALSYYRLAVANGLIYSDSLQLPKSVMGLARLFKNSGNTDSSVYYAKKVLEFSRPENPLQAEAGKLLFELFVNKNDKEAIKYLSLAMTAMESNLNLEKNRQVQNLLQNEKQRQLDLGETSALESANRKQNLQYAAIALGLVIFIILFLLLSHSVVANQRLINFLGILALLIVFEFINLFLHPYLDKMTDHSPVLMLGIMVAIAALLIPLHHRLEKWITHRLVEKNKKIRLESAKRTIAKLENDSTN